MMHLESYWAVPGSIAVVIDVFIMAYCFYCFAAPFAQDKRGARYGGILYCLVTSAIIVFQDKADLYIAYSVGMIGAFLVMCWAERRNYEQKIFLAVTFFALEWLTRSMADILYDHFYDFTSKSDFMKGHPELYFALYVVVLLYYLLLKFAFAMTGIVCIVKAYTYKYAKMAKRELLMLVIPSFAAIIGYEAMRYYRAFYIWETGKLQDIYDLLFFLFCAVFVIMIVVIIMLYQSIKATQEEKLQNELFATQMDSIRQHIVQVESLYRDIHSLKHDMGNHIMTLERLYEEKETAEAKAYSSQLKAALAEMAGEIKSGNPVTDVILQEMMGEAKKKGICFRSAFYYPTDSKINAFDISIILHNALQNALENVDGGESSYISILSYRKRNAYMIEIKNSYTGTIQWHPETGLPMTSKEKMPGSQSGYMQTHGYGLSNIRRVAKKYAGDIDITAKDGAFCLSVMLLLA